MKTSEFIEKVKDLGYECSDNGENIQIGRYDWWIYLVNKDTLYSINTGASIEDENEKELLSKLFELMVEYASTPIDEREEEVKYYLRQRPMFHKTNSQILNYGVDNCEWFYFNDFETERIKTQFTEKEIEKLGYKLNDFAYCVVGTDEWLNTGV